jgi:DNA-binding NtrC family response regulator
MQSGSDDRQRGVQPRPPAAKQPRESHPDQEPIRVLIVDDEADSSEWLRFVFMDRGGYDVATAATAAAAEQTCREWKPELVLLDMMLPDADGLELLGRLKRLAPDTDVIMVSAYGSIPKALQALRDGALTFVEKPVDLAMLLSVVDRLEDHLSVRARVRLAQDPSAPPRGFDGILSSSPTMHRLFETVQAVAPTDASVLLRGENGTGKEVFATAIHAHSRRASRPFIKINCAAIPPDLLEAELFGHRKGAFTGAAADKVGLIELAHGGSLLLDEIAELPPHLQVKLLRVLQEQEFRPVGDTRVVRSDFRLICATNVDLQAALESGRLREDLYYRINTVMMVIPPLRDRLEDVPLLAEHFLRRFADRHGRTVQGFDPAAMRVLLGHRWPGNVRELEHVVERAVIMSVGPLIAIEALPPSLRDVEAPSAEVPMPFPDNCTLEEIERIAIQRTLERTRGNKRAAAEILGVYRPTLYAKLRKYRLWEKGAPTRLRPPRGE